MTAVTSSFRWIDTLEKEFDKAFVDLDLILSEMDPDQPELVDMGRDRMKEMSAAWAQLVHKTQTIFQTNCKLEVLFIRERSIPLLTSEFL
jgi:hypothetical protein